VLILEILRGAEAPLFHGATHIDGAAGEEFEYLVGSSLRYLGGLKPLIQKVRLSQRRKRCATQKLIKGNWM
jgi:hypothetical protein